MKSILRKMLYIVIAIVCIATIYSGKVHAISISLELSGNGIQDTNGIYLCTEKIPVGGILIVKAEQVIRNDMPVEGTPTGETSRSDVTSESEWKSSNEQIAKVENGIITGVAEGEAEITVTYEGQEEKFDVSVGGEVEYGFRENIMIVQKDKIKTIIIGKTLQLDIEGIEISVTNKDVNWSSSDERVAKVDPNGLVTATGVGKATIKAEYGTYDDTYEIEVKDESSVEPPIDIVDDTYNFFSSKEKIEINVGSSDKVEITAKAKEGLITIAEVLMVKDNWNVEWKIEDETIAKCVPEKGIENNKYGGTQIAGRATIQGLKSGTTTLVAKVKVSENRVEEIKIPITVSNAKKEDNTVADKNIAKTGEGSFLIIAGIASVMMLVYFRIKIRK